MNFRNTYKKDADTFVEDRGFPFYVSRGDANFATLAAEFASLPVGMTAVHSVDGDGWEHVQGCPFLEAAELVALKQEENRLNVELQALDYVGVKIATGRGTVEEYATQIAEMNAKAARVNAIRARLAALGELVG